MSIERVREKCAVCGWPVVSGTDPYLGEPLCQEHLRKAEDRQRAAEGLESRPDSVQSLPLFPRKGK